MGRTRQPGLTRQAGAVVAAAAPVFGEDDRREIQEVVERVLESGRLILGPHTERFEHDYRKYTGVRHAVAVSSCTAALQISLRYFGCRGRKVLLPVNSFPGAVTAVLDEGGVPWLAEMDVENFGIDVDDAVSRIDSDVAGAVVVHLAGLVSPGFDRLRDALHRRSLFLIEDASHAHGASFGDRKAGALADAGCFSFYPTKILTTGTGGMITTNDAGLARFARSVRHHGQDGHGAFLRRGNDWCMGEIQAAIGVTQLRRVDRFVDRRNAIVAKYREGLASETWLEIPSTVEGIRHAYYKLPARMTVKSDARELRARLYQEHGIENGSVYDPPCHLQPVFRDYFNLAEGAFPKAEQTLARQLCPPVHNALTDAEVDRAIQAIRAVAIDSPETKGFRPRPDSAASERPERQ